MEAKRTRGRERIRHAWQSVSIRLSISDQPSVSFPAISFDSIIGIDSAFGIGSAFDLHSAISFGSGFGFDSVSDQASVSIQPSISDQASVSPRDPCEGLLEDASFICITSR